LKHSKIDFLAENFDLYEKPKTAPKPIAYKPTDQKSFETHPVQSKNTETDRLIKYVSTHKDSMSSDSINHFARLIGLIKLGEI
jgi:hypothetical protein